MPSVRLTNEIREEITAAMLRHRFSKDVAKLVAMRAVLAERVYCDFYSQTDRKKIAALPDGWLPERSEIRFRAGASYTSLPFNGTIQSGLNAALGVSPEIVRKPFAHKDQSGCVKSYDASSPIAEAYSEVEAALADLRDRYNEAKSQIAAALSRATTTGKLVDLWPEAAPFCKPYEAAAPSLPAIQTSALNAMLGLPVAA